MESTVLKSNRAVITALSYSGSGTLLAVGDSTGKIVLYSRVKEGEYTVQTTLWGFHTGRVNRISWNAKDTHVASAALDTNLCIYSVESPMRYITFLGAHKDGANAVDWVDDGKIVSVGSDGAVKLWEVKF